MEGVTASAEDWPRTCCTQMSAEAEAVDIFYAPLSWDALAIDEAVMLLPNFFLKCFAFLQSLKPCLGRSIPAAALLRQRKQ